MSIGRHLNLNTRRVALALLLASLVIAPAQALDPQLALSQYRVARWTVADGLPHGSISALHQDRDGFLWIGTYRGAVRFDGARFLPLSALVDGAIEPDLVETIGQTDDGVLWFGGTHTDLLGLAPDGRLQRYGPAQGLAARHVTLLHTDSHGQRWLGTGSGLLRMQGAWDGLRFEPELAQTVWQLVEDRDGALIAATENGPWRRASDGWHPLPEDGSLSHLHVWSIESDGADGWWFGFRGGLMHTTPDGQHLIGAAQGLPNPVVRDLLRDADGTLWAATAGGGLARLRDGRFQALGENGGLGTNVLWQLMIDREGDLWAGTAAGLARIRDATVRSFGPPEGLPSGMVWAVLGDGAGGHWVGLNGEGLAQLTAGGEVHRPGIPGIAPGASIVVSLVDTPEGLLVGTFGGLYRWAGGRFTQLAAVPTQRIRGLLRMDDGSVLVGLDRGLGRLRDGRFETLPGIGALGQAQVVKLRPDGHGAVLAAAAVDGVWRIEGDSAQRLDEPDGLPIRDVHRDAEGRLWLASIGLYWLDGRRLRPVQPVTQAFNTQFHALQPDAAGRLWASSNLGVLRIAGAALSAYADGRSDTLVFDSFGELEGMRSSEGNGGHQSAAHLDADGTLWVATTAGLVAIGAEAGPQPSRTPQARIERVVADGRTHWAAQALDFAAGVRRLEVEFTAVELGMPERLRFRYRLSPGAPGWVDLGAQRMVAFTDPGAGRYQLQVSAGMDGHFGDAAMVEFAVAPYWWQRHDLRIGALALLAGLLGLAYRARMRQARARQAELQREVALRTDELASANALLADAAQRDFLTGLGNRREFNAQLARTWAAGTPLALAVIDVDHFKAYNDHLGHLAGDACLARIGELLRALAGPTLHCARIGGEEFALLFEANAAAHAARLCDTLRSALREADLPHPTSSTGARVTVSIGLASRRDDDARAEDLHRRADQALYRAKGAGRDRLLVD